MGERMPTEGTITVQGEAVVPGEPDEARLRLKVSAIRTTPDEALDDVATRSHRLEAVLTELGIEKHKRSTSGLSVREKRERVEGAYVHRGYEAHNAILVRLVDPSLTGRLMREAVAEAQAHIDGPWWQIDPENAARARACAEAARDARRKAEAYASGLGLQLGPVLVIKESEIHRGRMLAAAQRSVAAAEIEIEAGELDVPANVEVTFGIER
jgi:uncharacterized protein YggE